MLLVAVSLPAQKDQSAPLTEDERILHVLSRLSFGPLPGQVVQVRGIGLDAWIDQQLDTEADSELETRLAGLYPTLGKSTAQQRALLEQRKADEGEKMTSAIADIYRESERDLRQAIVMRAVNSKAQLKELISDFWRNHLNVDSSKDTVQWVASHYEEHVIRKHALGKFPEMLWESAHHPAMLIYLDNSISRRPPSKSEQRTVRALADHQPWAIPAIAAKMTDKREELLMPGTENDPAPVFEMLAPWFFVLNRETKGPRVEANHVPHKPGKRRRGKDPFVHPDNGALPGRGPPVPVHTETIVKQVVALESRK
jgi:hypothetical protein